MLKIAEVAVLEAISRGGLPKKELLSLKNLSSLVGCALKPEEIYSAYTSLLKNKFLVDDLMTSKIQITEAGRNALDRADLLLTYKESFRLVNDQLIAANDHNDRLIDELHSQSVLADKQRKESEEKHAREKKIDRIYNCMIAIVSAAIGGFIQCLFQFLFGAG